MMLTKRRYDDLERFIAVRFSGLYSIEAADSEEAAWLAQEVSDEPYDYLIDLIPFDDF
jgi:hypothetical protein